MSPDHHHTAEEEKRIRDAALDATIEATFPASDAPSSLPNPDADDAITDERDTQRDERDRTIKRQS
jgi:hypothetical protein